MFKMQYECRSVYIPVLGEGHTLSISWDSHRFFSTVLRPSAGKSNACSLNVGFMKVIHLLVMPELMKVKKTSKKVIYNQKLDEVSHKIWKD